MNWKYILIFIILTVIVGGGILTYQYYYITQKEQPKIQTPTTEAPETETPAPITKSSNWKKYTDSNFEYSFYYPKHGKYHLLIIA